MERTTTATPSPQDVVDELLPRSEALIDELVSYVESGMPEIGSDEELSAGLYGSAADNLRLIFMMVSEGRTAATIQAPRRAIAYAEIMVRRGQPLSALLRAYRLGTMWFWTLWRREVTKRVDDPVVMMSVVDELMSFVFDYVDKVSEEVTEEFAAQRERWARTAAALRHETVLGLLEGQAVDVDQAERRLGYDLRGGHVAFVLWTRPESEVEDAIASLEAGAEAIGKALESRSVLTVPAGRATLWAWVAVAADADDTLVGQLGPKLPELAGVHAACGQPAARVEGFVTSHHEAIEAQAVALQMQRPPGRLIRYSRVVVPSLLVADPERARRFVARELGALCANDDATVRVRATLQVFLEEDSRFATTARRLGIHQNTVHYRVRQAEELLGHPLSERRFEIEAALRLLPLVGG